MGKWPDCGELRNGGKRGCVRKEGEREGGRIKRSVNGNEKLRGELLSV